MINRERVEQAHELLCWTLDARTATAVDQTASRYLSAALDVLCWLLEHEHNPNFEDNLERIRQAFEDAARRGEITATIPIAEWTVQ